jgi:ADP-ribosylglycohydrolase
MPAGWRYITKADYLDKVKGGFVGQLVGNIFGLPYEGQSTYTPGPADITYYKEVPSMAFSDDDTFVELVALKNLEDNGIDATPAQLAAEWMAHIPRGGVACANFVALENFHRGIMPPESGRPENNVYYLYIDAQIESEIYGLIAPGMPATAQEYAARFARLTNASDGVLGAIYMATLYSLAFFESDPERLVAQAMAALPPESRYAQVIKAAYDGFKAKPEFRDWRTVRNTVVRQYFRAGWSPNTGWVLADVNGAMVTLALLYGGGDFERTVQVAVQAGLDNDCNAATAAGVVGTMLGYSRLPEKWVAPVGEVYWNRSLMGFPQYMRISDIAGRIAAVGEQVVVARGGRVEQDQRELLVIKAQPVPQVAGYEPPVPEAEVVKHMAKPWNPAWQVVNPGFDMGPGLRTEYAGRSHVFVTHPKSTQVPVELRRTVTVRGSADGGADGKPVRTVLRIGVTNYDQVADCDWVLKVYVDDGDTETLLDQRVIQRVNGQHQWFDLEYDLTPWAGKTVTVRLLNVANNWYYEAGYWSYADIVEIVEGVER